jgi:hypothetical protein
MKSPLAAFFEFEVFDGIRSIDGQPVDACVAEGPIEQAASRADEGLSLTVFVVARLLADEHVGRCLRALAEDERVFEEFLPLHDVLRTNNWQPTGGIVH